MAFPGMTAAADLSAAQFHAVKISGSWQVDLADAATDVPVGILMDAPRNGQPASVASTGDVAKAKCSGAVTAGTYLAVDLATSGKLGRVTAAPAAANAYIVGIALEAGADGDVINLYVNTYLQDDPS